LADKKASAFTEDVAETTDYLAFFTVAETDNFRDTVGDILDIQNSTTKTLTNKTITYGDNTISGTFAEFNTAVTDATLVDLDDTQTLTNKTIDGDDNTIVDINETQMNVSVGAATTVLTSNGVGSAPSYAAPAGGEFTAAWTADHNQGGSAFGFRDALFVDPTVTTKKLQVDLSGMTASVIGVLAGVFTTAKTLTLPDATDTLVGKDTTDVFTNKSYDLGGTGNVLTGSTTEFNTALQSESFAFLGAANTFTGANVIDNATGLTFNNQGAGADPILLSNDGGQLLDVTGSFTISGTLLATTYTGQSGIVTLGTIATGTWEGDVVASAFLDTDTMHLSIAQTVTGKKTFGAVAAVGDFALAGTTSGSTVIDASAVASGVLTIPATTDTLVARDTTDTLTNKTMDGDVNTFVDINETQMNVSVGASTTVLTSNGVELCD